MDRTYCAEKQNGFIDIGNDYMVILSYDGKPVITGRYLYEKSDTDSWNNLVSISSGYSHVAGLKIDGTVVAVGENRLHECDVSEWNNIVAIDTGMDHTVGLRSDGTVVATGDNRMHACDVSEWSDIIQIDADSIVTIGLRADGKVEACGYNNNGQCDVGEWTDIVSVKTGGLHTVGLKNDGTVVATGFNLHGECNVSEWTDIKMIAVAVDHTVGLKSDGTVVASGNNTYGECDVAEWNNVVAIYAGKKHTIGLLEDGTLLATGDNSQNACNVSEWSNIEYVFAGDDITVAVDTSGKIFVTGTAKFYEGADFSDIVVKTECNTEKEESMSECCIVDEAEDKETEYAETTRLQSVQIDNSWSFKIPENFETEYYGEYRINSRTLYKKKYMIIRNDAVNICIDKVKYLPGVSTCETAADCRNDIRVKQKENSRIIIRDTEELYVDVILFNGKHGINAVQCRIRGRNITSYDFEQIFENCSRTMFDDIVSAIVGIAETVELI